MIKQIKEGIAWLIERIDGARYTYIGRDKKGNLYLYNARKEKGGHTK